MTDSVISTGNVPFDLSLCLMVIHGAAFFLLLSFLIELLNNILLVAGYRQTNNKINLPDNTFFHLNLIKYVFLDVFRSNMT